jgi:hypothetical protein
MVGEGGALRQRLAVAEADVESVRAELRTAKLELLAAETRLDSGANDKQRACMHVHGRVGR